jgi:hypothetical protein
MPGRGGGSAMPPGLARFDSASTGFLIHGCVFVWSPPAMRVQCRSLFISPLLPVTAKSHDIADSAYQRVQWHRIERCRLCMFH